MQISTRLVKLFFIGSLLSVTSLSAQVLTSKQIDSVVEKTLTTFNVPGIAVAVIKDGKVIHSKGYGVRSIKNNLKRENPYPFLNFKAS